MRDVASVRPAVFLLLTLPNGISIGFVSVTLPFILTRAGLPVATVASIVAIALVSNTWRFAMAPLVDLTLTLRRWYVIGLALSIVTLVLLAAAPSSKELVGVLTSAALLSQIGANLLITPIGGMMAHLVAEREKGRASGWYQAGAVIGTGVGGGLGVSLVERTSPLWTGVVLAGAMLLCVATLLFIPDTPRPTHVEGLRRQAQQIIDEFRQLLHSSEARFVIVLVMSPIAAGALISLWSAVAPAWSVTGDQIAALTGVGYGFLSAIGCLVGGWVADRLGRWWMFFGSQALLTVVAIGLEASPRVPSSFAIGVLCYAFANGLGYAAYTAVIVRSIGRGAAATKYGIVSSLGNIPIAYMTAADGWAHGRWGASGMLIFDAVVGAAGIPLALIVLWRLARRVGWDSPSVPTAVASPEMRGAEP